MKFLLLLTLPALLSAQTSVVDDFHKGLAASLLIIDSASNEIPVLDLTFNDLAAGITNLNNWPVTAADLAASATDIHSLAQQAIAAQNQPFDVTQVQVWPSLNILASLRNLLPSNAAQFQLSVTAHGGIGGLVATAIPLVNQLIVVAF